MSKKNSIAYIKPEEPSFLKKLKAQIGYKEGPTVETKRELPTVADLAEEDPALDDAPQVVVLKDGDLTAEEVQAEKEKLKKEEENRPADLTQRVVFRSTKKGDNKTEDSAEIAEVNKEEKGKSQKRQLPEERPDPNKKKRKESKKSAAVLSFDVDDLDDC